MESGSPLKAPEPASRRVAVIVGRPNVGKSALFNRLIGARIAIVHEESGVTRDRLQGVAVWQGQRFEVIDTGGLVQLDGARAPDEFAAGIERQVETALEDAAVVICVTDLTAGVVPLDVEVVRRLRQAGKPVLLAANKADRAQLDERAADFESLGYPVFPISVLHNRGVNELVRALVAELPPDVSDSAEPDIKVVVVGRPNVGKSSYLNELLGRERLLVTAVPGTTRDSIEVPLVVGEGPAARRYTLIDTAGMRRAGRVREAVERFSLLRAQRSIARADVAVLMLDAIQGPTELDKKIAALMTKYRKGCVLLVNKWDLAEGVDEDEYLRALRRVLPFFAHVPVQFVSALDGHNVRKSLEAIGHVAEQVRLSLPTGVLNRVLHNAVDRVQPPQVAGRRLKLFYATQTGVAPIRVRLFVNDPRRATPAYLAYLVRTLRGAFGLEGAPVVLECRSRPGSPSIAAEKRPRKKGKKKTFSRHRKIS